MTVRIAFLGDTLLGGEAQPILDRRGYGYAFQGLTGILSGADLAVANLEGPLTSSDRPMRKLHTGAKRYWYRARPESVEALVGAGVRVVSLANNHVLDHGPGGLAETIATLDAAGIAHCGAGPDEAHARRPAAVTVNGCRIGFVSYMQRYDLYARERLYASESRPGPLRLRPTGARRDLETLRGLVDLCIVLVHWGRNYRDVTPLQERLAAVLRGTSADLVVGHHPHVVQRIDLTGDCPVLFSLGNGPFGTLGRYGRDRPPYGLIAVAEIESPPKISRLELTLLRVDNTRVGFRPTSVADSKAHRFLRSLLPPHSRAVQTGTGLTVPTT